jgi:hypothetical protein
MMTAAAAPLLTAPVAEDDRVIVRYRWWFGWSCLPRVAVGGVRRHGEDVQR